MSGEPREIYLETEAEFVALVKMLELCRDARGLRQYVDCTAYPLVVGNVAFLCVEGDPSYQGTALRRGLGGNS